MQVKKKIVNNIYFLIFYYRKIDIPVKAYLALIGVL